MVVDGFGRNRLAGPPHRAHWPHLVELWHAGTHASAELAELSSVAPWPIYRAVQRAWEPTSPKRPVRSPGIDDESGCGSRYHTCVAVVANGNVDGLRRLVRSSAWPANDDGFVHERESRRRQIIDALVGSDQVTADRLRKGRDTKIRVKSFRRMVRPVLDRSVTRLISGSHEGRDDLAAK